MKYYATVESEKRGARPAKKGGDESLKIELTKKGLFEFEILFSDKGLKVTCDEGTLLDTAEPKKA